MIQIVLFLLYLSALVFIAYKSKQKTNAKSPYDFYIASGKLGFLVLIFTLFATQYSGNNFLAFPGKAYRMGYVYIMSVTFMMSVIFGYLLFAPGLKKIADKKNYITPGDWIHDRFGSTSLTVLCSSLMVYALLNYLLAQIMAVGHAFSGFTDGQIPYEYGVIFIALIIVVYEIIGGMRAVVWTDTIQGILMLLSVLILGGYLLYFSGDIIQMPEEILKIAPEKIMPPSFETCVIWASTIILVMFGASMYPQAIQRLYAAKSTRILKRSLMVMVFLPLVVTFFAYLIGIHAITMFPDLSTIKSDTVMAAVLSHLAEKGLFLNVVVSILLLGALAAIMSTADSVLLTLSSILAKDYFGRFRPETSAAGLMKVGKSSSLVLMIIIVLIALNPHITLWRLIEIKLEFLMQLAPIFILGLRYDRLNTRTVLIALITGTAIIITTKFFAIKMWHGIHIGTLAFFVNFAICFIGIKSANIKLASKGCG